MDVTYLNRPKGLSEAQTVKAASFGTSARITQFQAGEAQFFGDTGHAGAAGTRAAGRRKGGEVMQAASVVVGSTATRLVGNGAAVPGGQHVLVKNTHTADKLIIGGPSVAAGNGFSIDAGTTLDIGYVGPSDPVWAIRGASADITAQVLALPS